MSDQTTMLLRALLATTGRVAFSEEQILEIVNPRGNSTKYVKAFNLADGNLSQGEIAKKAKLDSGNFSRVVNRWVRAGIIFRLEENVLLHVYPISQS